MKNKLVAQNSVQLYWGVIDQCVDCFGHRIWINFTNRCKLDDSFRGLGDEFFRQIQQQLEEIEWPD